MFVADSSFEWDLLKDLQNQEKHAISFANAQVAFVDPKRVVLKDLANSTSTEMRYFCLGMVDRGVLTVRFTMCDDVI